MLATVIISILAHTYMIHSMALKQLLYLISFMRDRYIAILDCSLKCILTQRCLHTIHIPARGLHHPKLRLSDLGLLVRDTSPAAASTILSQPTKRGFDTIVLFKQHAFPSRLSQLLSNEGMQLIDLSNYRDQIRHYVYAIVMVYEHQFWVPITSLRETLRNCVEFLIIPCTMRE